MTATDARPRYSGFRLDGGDRDALVVWFAYLAAVWTLAGAVGWLVAEPGAPEPSRDWFERFAQWDAIHFAGIAVYGYGGEPTGVPNEAFFPGLPLLERVGLLFGVSAYAGGAVVSAVAGAVAAVALARLGRATVERAATTPSTSGSTGGSTAGSSGGSSGRIDPGVVAVLAWVVAPSAVFLAAPYTESLFLALALPAWLAARAGHWRVVGVLSALACLVRVSGVFLVVALAVAWLVGTDPGAPAPQRRPQDLAWLGLPALALLAWMAYLRAITGDWLAWLHAQQSEWSRDFTAPWNALITTWEAATGAFEQADFTWMFRAEIVAVAVGVLLTIFLLVRTRWAESTWVGLQVAAFATSSSFFSVPRATLLWWPLWLTIAALGMRRPRLLVLYLAVSAGLSVAVAVAFLTGRWAG